MSIALLSKSKYIVILMSSISLLACSGTTETSLTELRVTGKKEQVTLTWTAPTLNTDNTDLIDIAAYNIYYGTSADSLTAYVTADKDSTEYSINNLNSNSKYYFAVKAVNSDGVESEFSNLVDKTL